MTPRLLALAFAFFHATIVTAAGESLSILSGTVQSVDRPNQSLVLKIQRGLKDDYRQFTASEPEMLTQLAVGSRVMLLVDDRQNIRKLSIRDDAEETAEGVSSVEEEETPEETAEDQERRKRIREQQAESLRVLASAAADVRSRLDEILADIEEVQEESPATDEVNRLVTSRIDLSVSGSRRISHSTIAITIFSLPRFGVFNFGGIVNIPTGFHFTPDFGALTAMAQAVLAQAAQMLAQVEFPEIEPPEIPTVEIPTINIPNITGRRRMGTAGPMGGPDISGAGAPSMPPLAGQGGGGRVPVTSGGASRLGQGRRGQAATSANGRRGGGNRDSRPAAVRDK